MKKVLRIALAMAVTPIFILSLLETAAPARAGSGVNPAANLPWKAQIFDDDLNTKHISVAFGGDHQYPIISYDLPDSSGPMRLAMPALQESGNCGPGGKWFCTTAATSAKDEITSRIATYNYRDSFKVGYIYKDPFLPQFYLETREYSNDLVYLTSTNVPILHLNIYNSSGLTDWRLTAPPVFVYDEVGNPHIATILQFGGGYKVLYIHKVTNGQPTTPCLVNPLVNPTLFQCDIIYESSVPFINSDSIKIVLSSAGTPRILFFQSNISGTTDALMYAYPTTLHANCGPGGTTWRCIAVDAETANVDFYCGGNDPILMDMAIGPNAPHIIAKAYNSTGALKLRYIKWVGTNGNCGYDYIGIGPMMDERWECTDVPWGGNLAANSSISLQVDSLDYPVIGLTWPSSSFYQAGLYYPPERAGIPSFSLWHFDKVDGTVYDTGMSVAFALDRGGRAFMAYTELEDYSPNLKIAYQDQFKIHLPMIKK